MRLLDSETSPVTPGGADKDSDEKDTDRISLRP